MRSKHGMVMGAFAWGHPFLDGNGRTMLLLHTELCARAGFSIDWRQAKKIDYLRNLTLELETPDKGLLDRYFQPLIRELMPRVDWVKHIKLLPGLDGTHESDDNIAYRDDDPVVLKRYAEAKRSRDESARKPF